MRVLISVSDKTGIIEFARTLVSLKADIISSGGTYKALKEAGVPVTEVSAYTGFPEMLDGRVKTLHPKIHGGLLGLRDVKEHVATMEKHGIEPIDLVIVNLYPFKKTIEKPGVHLEEAIENIDIGGPSMVRSASKNYRSVGIIVNPQRYPEIAQELLTNDGQLSLQTKEQLALEAFTHTAEYDSMIAAYLKKTFTVGEAPELLPSKLTLNLELAHGCRYGENPHQQAAFYRFSGQTGLADFVQHHGKELSFNNFLDMQAAWRLVREFSEPAAVVVKHTNPCGMAVSGRLCDAYIRAYQGDEISAFGGIVGLNRSCDVETARKINETFIEVVLAPAFDAEALSILKQKKNLRLVTLPNFFSAAKNLDQRSVDGGMLVQEQDVETQSADSLQFVTERAPSDTELANLLFAWRVVQHVKSNAIVVAKVQQVLGVGCGYTNRVDAVDYAIRKAGTRITGACMASDAFFPFSDSVEKAHKLGITAVIQPGGSLKDADSIAACNKNGMAMVFTGLRHFKH